MGGLVVGALFGAFFARESRPWRISIVVNGAAALSALAIAVSLVLPNFSPLWRQFRDREEARQRLRDYVEKPIPEAPRGTWEKLE